MEEGGQLNTYVILSLEKEYAVTIRQEKVWCVMLFSRKKSNSYSASICTDVQHNKNGAEAYGSLTSLKRQPNTNPNAEMMFVTLCYLCKSG